MSTVENKTNFTFLRIEKKFWLTTDQYEAIIQDIQQHMELDQYGLSLIYNIYFDTDDYYLIRRSIERPDFKEKIRLRSYGVPKKDSMVFLELKRKADGIGYKRRIYLKYQQALDLIEGKKADTKSPQIQKELEEFISRYQPKPKAILKYYRQSYYGKKDSNFKISFDRDIGYHPYCNGRDLPQDNFLPVNGRNQDVLMEIKCDKAIEDWLLKKMSDLKIYQAPFSKIGTCYTKYIAEKKY